MPSRQWYPLPINLHSTPTCRTLHRTHEGVQKPNPTVSAKDAINLITITYFSLRAHTIVTTRALTSRGQRTRARMRGARRVPSTTTTLASPILFSLMAPCKGRCPRRRRRSAARAAERRCQLPDASGTMSAVDGPRAPSCTSHPCHFLLHRVESAGVRECPPVHGRGLTVDSPQTTLTTSKQPSRRGYRHWTVGGECRGPILSLSLSSLPRARPHVLH